jgi:hypothetical protein
MQSCKLILFHPLSLYIFLIVFLSFERVKYSVSLSHNFFFLILSTFPLEFPFSVGLLNIFCLNFEKMFEMFSHYPPVKKSYFE